MKMIALRLKPGQDLKLELQKFVETHNIRSGFIGTCVGSLHVVSLRMAGAKPEKQNIRTFEGDFEIVSLVGTVSISGTHLHLSVSGDDGRVIGGHLKEGSLITTTAEIVICYDESVAFERILDSDTGFDELTVSEV